MVNNIKNNTISEIEAKKDLNALNKLKNVEIIKNKKRTPEHKKLLHLFNNLLNIILTDKTSESQENENEKVENKKEENEKVEHKTEENKNEYYENEYENENEDEYYENENEDDDDDETIDQNDLKELNDYLDEIEKPKPFEEQIKSLKKIENLEGYYFTNDFDDKEESKSKIFKLKLAHL